ncbi:MAG: amidohydrolase family protein [Thermanaerothrix sp.]|nr:amidohydrolase family protein [Thermanaerothrix sp.]
MILDFHVHIYPPEVVRDSRRIAEREDYFALLSSSKVHRWASFEELVEAMDRDGVDRAVAFGFAFKDLGLCRLCNDYVLEAARAYPDRIVPMAVVPPFAKGALEEVERARSLGAVGVGELFPEGQGFDIDDVRQTWRLAGLCHELGMFLMFHCAEPVGHRYPGKGTVGVKEAAAFCENHPEVKVVFAHFGGGLFLYESMEEMRLILSNAYYDTAAMPFLYGHSMLKAAMAVAPRKMLFGTDFPILGIRRYASLLDRACLGAEAAQALLGLNGEAFLSSIKEGLRL